jgi:hypothetical protein
MDERTIDGYFSDWIHADTSLQPLAGIKKLLMSNHLHYGQ